MFSSDKYNIKPLLIKTIEEIIEEIKNWGWFNESSNRKLIKKILREGIGERSWTSELIE